jgi:hypothetical protein
MFTDMLSRHSIFCSILSKGVCILSAGALCHDVSFYVSVTCVPCAPSY